MTSNKYNENQLTYLDERKLEANKNNVRFREFWDIWHTNDLNRLNETVEGVDSDLELGGRWRPPDCQSRFRVAIIIPYRDRLPHLMVLVKYLHVFLKRQMIDYQIFVVEPTTPLTIKFNKGRVMNSGKYFFKLFKPYSTKFWIFFDTPKIYGVNFENDLGLN